MALIRRVDVEITANKGGVVAKYKPAVAAAIPGNVMSRDLGAAVAYAVKCALDGDSVPFIAPEMLHVKATVSNGACSIEFDMKRGEDVAARINAALGAVAETKTAEATSKPADSDGNKGGGKPGPNPYAKASAR